MGRWLNTRGDGRREVDLHQLPRWIKLGLAVIVVLAVVALARSAEREPDVPSWLPVAIHIGGWAVLVLVPVLLVRWIVRRRRRHGAADDGGTRSSHRPKNHDHPAGSPDQR